MFGRPDHELHALEADNSYLRSPRHPPPYVNLQHGPTDFDTVVQSWFDLYHALCNFICQDDFTQSQRSHLDQWLADFDVSKGGTASKQDILLHPMCNPKYTIQRVHANLHKAFLRIAEAAHRCNQRSRIPDDDMKKKNLSLLVRAGHPHVWKDFLHLIDTHEPPIDTMPYEQFVQWIFRAARKPSAMSPIVAYINSILGDPGLQSKPSISTPSSTSSMSPDREPPKAQQTPKVEAVYITQAGHILEALVGPGVTATAHDRANAAAANKCSNCLNWKSRKYPPHMSHQCPYTTPNCVPRQQAHTPITPTSGRPFTYQSSAETIDKFIHARALLLEEQAVNVTKEMTIQQMAVRFSAEDEHEVEFVVTPEPPRIVPTLPPSPWNFRPKY